MGTFRRRYRSVAMALASLMLLAGCGLSAAAGSTANTASASHQGPFKVAFSNAFIDSNFRVQEQKDMQTVANEFVKQGLISSYTAYNANNSVSTQISQINDIIQNHPNLLIVDATSATALNPVIQKAVQAGIKVISVNDLVTSPYVTRVNVNYIEYGKLAAQGLVKLLHGKGNIVSVRGDPGLPADVTIWTGEADVLNHYPNIHIVSTFWADWNPPTAEAKMASLLATGIKFNGVITQGGEAWGVAKAMINAHRPLVPIIGGGTVGFLQIWNHYRKLDGYNAYTVGNPPALASYALEVGMMELQGMKVPKFVTIPLVPVTDQNLSQYLNQPIANRFDQLRSYSNIQGIVKEELAGKKVPFS
ncbi:MAG: substrate-binding domain-containing protein [Thermaerobacter sp.]|nr:substrate-binding domain-containing protein [Thermaerobacter sp.]